MCAIFFKGMEVFADSYKIIISCKVTSSKVLTISDKVFKSQCEVFSSIEANAFLCVFQKKTLWVISVFLLIGEMALDIKKYNSVHKTQMLNFLVFQKAIQLRINNSNLIFQEPTITLNIMISVVDTCSKTVLPHQCNHISDHLSRSKIMYIYIPMAILL